MPSAGTTEQQPQMATNKQQQPQPQVVRGGLERVKSAARDVYARVESYNNYSVVKYSLDQVQRLSQPLQPVVMRVSQYSEPIIERLDSALVQVDSRIVQPMRESYSHFHPVATVKESAAPSVQYLQERLRGAVPQEWIDRVEEVYRTQSEQLQQRVISPTEQFFNSALEQFHLLRQQSLGSVSNVSASDFVASLRQRAQDHTDRLYLIWDEKLVAPAQQLFDAAKQAYTKLEEDERKQQIAKNGSSEIDSRARVQLAAQVVRDQLGAQWHSTVAASIDYLQSSPYAPQAQQFYQTAIDALFVTVEENNSSGSGSSASQPGDHNSTSSSENGSSTAATTTRRTRLATPEELVVRVRAQLGQAWDSRFMPLLSQLYYKATQVLPETTTDLVADSDGRINAKGVVHAGLGALSASQEKVQHAFDLAATRLESHWLQVLALTGRAVDYVLPADHDANSDKKQPSATRERALQAATAESEQKGDAISSPRPLSKKDLSLRTLSNTVSRRVMERMQRHWGQVRHFSSERLSHMVHVDLIAYAEHVIDKSSRTSQQLMRTSQDTAAQLRAKSQQVYHAVADPAKQRANTLLIEPARQTLSRTSHTAVAKVQPLLQQQQQRVTAVLQPTRQRLQRTSTDGRRLLRSFTSYLWNAEFTAMPNDAYHMATSLLDLKQRHPQYQPAADDVRRFVSDLAELCTFGYSTVVISSLHNLQHRRTDGQQQQQQRFAEPTETAIEQVNDHDNNQQQQQQQQNTATTNDTDNKQQQEQQPETKTHEDVAAVNNENSTINTTTATAAATTTTNDIDATASASSQKNTGKKSRTASSKPSSRAQQHQ